MFVLSNWVEPLVTPHLNWFGSCLFSWSLFSLNKALAAGDIESMPFIEALGQFSHRVGKK